LRSLGVRIALDDFGTGYSSLSTLRAFPLDALKIDRSFVSDLTTDHGDRTIVSAIAALGHALGMRIVAEGAETMEQVTAVRDLGCDRVQGYVLGMPL
ncbi:EAL domain-containing protein, partial [bacterium]|nr:EAL domain-containing protein [bacterium]